MMNRTSPTTRPALPDYRWLVSDAARPFLASAAADVSDGQKLLHAAMSLRKSLSAERAHLVLEQAELRRKAKEKFPAAEQMFFSPRGLEQATDAWIARYKAGRFQGVVVDLCCGIGGDLMALRHKGHVLGIDRDSVAALLCAANTTAASVCVADAADLSMDCGMQWHLDPDRRAANRRTSRVDLGEPGPATIRRLLGQSPNGAVKLAPSAAFSEPWWNEAELEWIGRDRECRQLVAWFGGLARALGKRCATVVFPIAGSTDSESERFTGEPNIAGDIVANMGRYIFEPHATVLAGKLGGALAVKYGLSAITPGIAYFTSDHPIENRLLSCFEVLDVLPYKIKSLKSWLAERRIGRLEIKKRGVDIDPTEVRAKLSPSGDTEATLILTRAEGKTVAIVARRLYPS